MSVDQYKRLESKEKLLEIKWLDVPAWDFLRHRFLQENKKIKRKKITKNWTIKFIDYKKLFCLRKKINYIFFGVSQHRYEAINANIESDKWCDPLISIIGKKECLKILGSGRANELDPQVISSSSINFLTNIWKLFGPKKHAKKIAKSIALLCKHNEIKTPNKIENILLSQWSLYYTHLFIFKFLRPKIIFIVCSYGKESQILAAKKLNIPVIELQHGVISSWHVGYSFPYNYKKKAFPDYLFLYGASWAEGVYMPIEPQRLIEIGFASKEATATPTSIDTNLSLRTPILFVSQWTISQKFIDFVLAFSDLLPQSNYEIIFRPHPIEQLSEDNKKSLENAGVEIQYSETINIYDSFKAVSYVIGVSSTALYEAAALGKKVGIIKPLIEHQSRMNFLEIEDPSHLLDIFLHNKWNTDINQQTEDRFFIKFNTDNFLRKIKLIERNSI